MTTRGDDRKSGGKDEDRWKGTSAGSGDDWGSRSWEGTWASSGWSGGDKSNVGQGHDNQAWSAHKWGRKSGDPCTFCSGSGKSTGDASWDFWKLDGRPEKWVAYLEESGCDKTSIADFCSLSQTRHGYDAAMQILHKMLKKEAGMHAVRNPSAFVSHSCKTAYHGYKW